MIDASIPLGIKPPQIEDPTNALLRVLQMRSLQQEGDMNSLKAEATRRDFDRTNKLYSLLQSNPDAATLRQNGYLKEAGDLEKNAADVGKTKAETTKNTVESATKKLALYRDSMFNVGDGQTAAQLITAMHQDPDLKGSGIDAVPLEKLLAQIPQDPGQFAGFKQQFSLGAEKFMADMRAREGHAVTMRGQDITSDTTRRGQDMTDSRTREEGAANRGVTVRGQNLTDARSREANSAGKVPAGYRQKADGSLEFIPGGPADPNAARRAAPTEDERKASGWLAQAMNGFSNMEKALKDDPKANKPGVIESVPMVPEGMKNMSRSDARQRFNQGASSFAEAALRAATGAGVNESEARQKIAELTPQWGDTPGNIQQKRDGLQVYLQSLATRAGRAGTGAPPPQSGGATGSFSGPSVDDLLKKYGGM